MKIFFSVGEPSGDEHTAHLIEELRWRDPEIEATGFGGPAMQAAGCDLQYQLTDLAVMGIAQVLPLVPKFYRLAKQAERYFREQRPDAVVLVDFPGFNWQIAKRAKAAGIPVFYYLPPQLWAWGSWRIRRVRKYVDCVLCALPFEHDWYTERGIRAEYVGHPFFDEVASKELDEDFLAAHRQPGIKNVGILPGSRTGEIKQNWPLMLDAMWYLASQHPEVRFLVAGYKDKYVEALKVMLAESGYDLPVEFYTGKTSEIIEVADCCLMVSGSVSLEILARRTPSAVMYRVDWLIALLKWFMLKVDYISLPNLIADRMVLPEWVISGAPDSAVDEITNTLDGWLTDPRQLAAAKAELELLSESVIQTGASARTADCILQALESTAQCRAA